MKSLITFALLLIAATAPTVANAVPVTTTTFAFSGLCDDCAGVLIGTGPFHARGDGMYQSVSGTLVLQNFVPGAPLNISNFSSFTYNGSSILAPFTLNSSQNTTEHIQLSGTLSASGTVQSPFFALDWNQPPPALLRPSQEFSSLVRFAHSVCQRTVIGCLNLSRAT